MSEPTLSCYEIYLKGVYNGSLVLISLPPSMGSRFKTTDPTPPSNSFIYSLISKKDVSDNIDSIREYNFDSDWIKGFVRDKIIRRIIETGTYTIDYKKINCDKEPDTIKGDPSNADKPYPSVSDEDTPPNKDGDPSNSDGKCHFADFTITIVIAGLVARRIQVKLRTNQNPLPAPINPSLRDKETIIQYIQSVGGQNTAEQISDSMGVGAVLSIDWDGDFWKPCAEKNDPDDPNEPDPQMNKSVCIKRPETIRMSDLSQIGDKESTYCAKLNGVTTSNVLMIDGLYKGSDQRWKKQIKDYVDQNSLDNPLNYLSPSSVPAGNNQGIIDALGINAASVNMFVHLFAPQWLRDRTIKIAGDIRFNKGENPPNTPDNITITLKIDTILNYEFYFVGDPPIPPSAQLINTADDELLETIRLEMAEKIDNEFTGEPGIDFEKVWDVVRDKSVLEVSGGPVRNKKDFIKKPKVLNKIFKISVPVSGQPFTLDLKKTTTTVQSSGPVTETRRIYYELSLDDPIVMNRLIYELKEAIKENSPKIFGEMLKIVYGDEDAEPGPFDLNPEDRNVIKPYLDQVVDTCRGILISKAKKATRDSNKNPACVHLQFPSDNLELELFNHKVSFSKPK